MAGMSFTCNNVIYGTYVQVSTESFTILDSAASSFQVKIKEVVYTNFTP